MKKITLLFIGVTLLSIFKVSAQKEIDTYYMDYFGEEFKILASEPEKNGKYSFYIRAYSQERKNGTVSLVIESKKLDDFREALVYAKDKYVEWKQTAIDNNVEDLSKDIDTKKVRALSGFVYGREWHFDFNTLLNFRFKILNGKYLLILENAHKLQASDNQYIDYDGFFIIFKDVEEIDDFLSKVTEEKVIKFFEENSNKEDLFKQ